MIDKFTVLFFTWNTRLNKAGQAPIMVRITFKGERKQFASGMFTDPKQWDSKKQRMIGDSSEAETINNSLMVLQEKLNRAYLKMELSGEDFAVEDILREFKGETEENQTVKGVFDIYLKRIEKQVGIDRTPATFGKYKVTLQHIQNFIKHKYHKNDLPLKSLNPTFMEDFDYYMKTELRLKQVTINKSAMQFKGVIRFAVAQDFLQKDPFLNYRMPTVKRTVVFLTDEELTRMEWHRFAQKRLQQVTDCFIFCCYTGLGYHEMSTLTQAHIQKGFDGNQWIIMTRKKTQRDIAVPLLPKALEIIEEYRSDERKTLLPVLSNQRFNSNLKEIAEMLEINKRLTHHTARKTFASTVLLYNDVPMEIVSQLLGHSKLSTTEGHYAKVVNRKVSQAIQSLTEKLTPPF
ncbi:site-specific integrase [Alistipes sp. OttesenSCG-928-L06]|nr:site-specific integrase [Alistipes sp. OttesenSCG-928-L06]